MKSAESRSFLDVHGERWNRRLRLVSDGVLTPTRL